MPGLSDKKSARPRPAAAGAPAVPAGHRAGPLLLAAALLISGAWASPRPAKAAPRGAKTAKPAAAAGKAAPAPRAPVAVIAAFDSLLAAGDLPAARALCTGQVLRMFDFLALAQARMASLVDSARSREDTLADSASGDWAYVKMASHVVFRRPFMGQSEMRSVQAVHLWKSPRGWLLAEFEELESAGAPVAFRTGRPPGPDPAAAGAGRAATGPAAAAPPGAVRAPEGASADAAVPRAAAPGSADSAGPVAEAPAFFPVSPTAPARAGEADWLRYRLRLRNGGRLADLCPLDGRQARAEEVSASEWILENARAALPRGRGRAAAKGRAGRKPAEPPGAGAAADSLAPYLASNAYLDLEDSLLQSAAAEAAGASADPVARTGSIRRWVTAGFRFRLGAVLFGTSREVLRDMTGDCSEAAILTAALLRASGIPSRVALGFASAGRGVFIGHAWTEAWLGEGAGWVGVDAALGQFPAGVERVRLLHLDGRADMRIAATNLMLAALSNLDIEILAARKGGRALELVAHPGAAEEGAGFFAEILRGMDAGD